MPDLDPQITNTARDTPDRGVPTCRACEPGLTADEIH